jgi:periplasmic protein CpxP/Spy
MIRRCILIFPALALGWCALFITAHLVAQSVKATEKLERLAADLALTPQQKRQLIPILASEAPKVEAIKADSSLSKIQKLEQLKAVHDQTDPQVKAILTPEQYQKLQAIRRQELEQAMKRRLNQ